MVVCSIEGLLVFLFVLLIDYCFLFDTRSETKVGQVEASEASRQRTHCVCEAGVGGWAEGLKLIYDVGSSRKL